MTRIAGTVVFLIAWLGSAAQDHVVAAADSAEPSLLYIKWYADPLVSEAGFNVYRQEKGKSVWVLVTPTPVRYMEKRVPAAALEKDPDLSAHVTMASHPANLKGLGLLAVLIKSFRSPHFCEFLGIATTDAGVIAGKRYRYRVARITGTSETDVGISSWVKAGVFMREGPPQGLSLTRSKRNVRVQWRPEPIRFYAAHVYRRISDTGSFRQITAHPVLVSRGKDSTGGSFFEDRDLPLGIPVYYRIIGVDLFGRPTQPGEIEMILLKDDESPRSVDSVTWKVSGRSVSLGWFKGSHEKDLAGFNVYRTTHNDSDFKCLNRQPQKTETMLDRVDEFGQYFYRIVAVDNSGNESPGRSYMVEVYDNEPPRLPAKIEAIGDSFTVKIRWARGREDDLAGYHVYRTMDRDEPSAYVKLTPRPVECCGFSDTLPANVRNTILYRLVAIDKSLNRSGYSPPIAVKLSDRTPPARPFIYAGKTDSIGRAVISWFRNPEPDLKAYELMVRYEQDSSGSYQRAEQISRNASECVYQPTTDGMHSYQIIALDSAGNRSPMSNAVFIRRKPLRQNIPAPTLTARYSARRNEVSLRWDQLNAAIRGYMIYRRGEAGVFEPVSGLITEDRVIDSAVNPGMSYVYQLRVYTEKGDVMRSEELTVNTTILE